VSSIVKFDGKAIRHQKLGYVYRPPMHKVQYPYSPINNITFRQHILSTYLIWFNRNKLFNSHTLYYLPFKINFSKTTYIYKGLIYFCRIKINFVHWFWCDKINVHDQLSSHIWKKYWIWYQFIERQPIRHI